MGPSTAPLQAAEELRQRCSLGRRDQPTTARTNRPERRLQGQGVQAIPPYASSRDPSSDSTGMAFGGNELVPELDKIATAPQKTKWLRACCLPEARRMDRHQTSELFCNRRTNMRRWWSWPPKNTASTWTSRCSARGRNQYTARSRAR